MPVGIVVFEPVLIVLICACCVSRIWSTTKKDLGKGVSRFSCMSLQHVCYLGACLPCMVGPFCTTFCAWIAMCGACCQKDTASFFLHTVLFHEQLPEDLSSGDKEAIKAYLRGESSGNSSPPRENSSNDEGGLPSMS
jgi:hypothetical protein